MGVHCSRHRWLLMLMVDQQWHMHATDGNTDRPQVLIESMLSYYHGYYAEYAKYEGWLPAFQTV